MGMHRPADLHSKWNSNEKSPKWRRRKCNKPIAKKAFSRPSVKARPPTCAYHRRPQVFELTWALCVCVCVFFFDAPKLFWWIQVRARHVGHFRQSRVLVHFLICATNTLSWAILALQCQQNQKECHYDISWKRPLGQKCQFETHLVSHSCKWFIDHRNGIASEAQGIKAKRNASQSTLDLHWIITSKCQYDWKTVAVEVIKTPSTKKAPRSVMVASPV